MINFISLFGLIISALGTIAAFFSVSSPALGALLTGLGVFLTGLMFFPSTYILFAKGLRDTPWLAWLLSFPAIGALGFLAYLSFPHPINDISTDLQKVPSFESKLYRLPVPDAANLLDDSFLVSRDYNPSYAAIQMQTYPDLRNLEVKAPAEKVFPLLKKTVIEQLPQWKIVLDGNLRFEAEVRSRVFKFVDDVIVEVRPSQKPIDSLIVVRSRSRTGKSDLGANAKRINDLLVRFRLATDGLVAQEAKSRPEESPKEKIPSPPAADSLVSPPPPSPFANMPSPPGPPGAPGAPPMPRPPGPVKP